jgi:hypothetical protein
MVKDLPGILYFVALRDEMLKNIISFQLTTLATFSPASVIKTTAKHCRE